MSVVEQTLTNYRISSDNKLIFMQINGQLSVRDIASFIHEVSTAENYDPLFNSIVDIRGLKTTISALDAQELIELSSLIMGEASAKSAVVTDGYFKEKLVNVANWLCKRKNIEIKGFTNMKDAYRWLDFDEKVLGFNL